MANTIAFSVNMMTAFANLPKPIQGKVTSFLNKFRNDPTSNGINFEKINGAADEKIYSVRIDQTYRGIVARVDDENTYILLWVDRHDQAYEWAKSKKCQVNKITQTVQVYDVISSSANDFVIPDQKGIFAGYSKDNLLAIGVPEEQIDFTRQINSIEELYDTQTKIPEDAYEGLVWLAEGIPLNEVIGLYQANAKQEENGKEFRAALQTPQSQRTYVVIAGEEELQRILAEPLEKWRVFLHPAQRKLVSRNFSGPARVLGGAGTGKTVAAMHRAKWLSSQLQGNERILFTTFTANLAKDINDQLQKICLVEEQRKIDVINLDAWVSQFLRGHGYPNKIIYGKDLDAVWEQAISMSGEDVSFSPSFIVDEWEKVVVAQEAFTSELYMKASRIGRGTRLDRKTRIQFWHIFEEYQNLQKEKQQRDVGTAMYECHKLLEATHEDGCYASVVVDEGQDMSMPAFRLLRALAGKEHPNDMFIVGDSHQRIYKNRAILSQCGINIRGRSSYLKINYRTTEEIRKYAFSLLKGITFDDLDEGYDRGIECQSLTHGDRPEVKSFKTDVEEFDYILEQIKALEAGGVGLKNICLVARTHSLIDSYIKKFTDVGIRTYEIRTSKSDDRFAEGIRVATIHRVKGLEFQYIFIAAANSRIIPLEQSIDHTDSVTEAETMKGEKCLLYVALTRAQKAAFVTSYGNPSEFLI